MMDDGYLGPPDPESPIKQIPWVMIRGLHYLVYDYDLWKILNNKEKLIFGSPLP